MYSMVNATNWVLVYRCINCLIYDDPTQTLANTSTTDGTYEQGWSQSYSPPYNPLDASSGFNQHNNGMGVFQVIVSSATIANYASYTTLTQSGGLTVSTTAATSTFSAVPVPTATSYDYVVVGAGAAGIPVAMRLNAAGHSVLLIEKGVASSYRWGGSMYYPSRRIRMLTLSQLFDLKVGGWTLTTKLGSISQVNVTESGTEDQLALLVQIPTK
jgi:cellobiose dehydrogenase (acceptor)